MGELNVFYTFLYFFFFFSTFFFQDCYLPEMRIVRYIFYILLVPLVLAVCIVVSIYLPPVHQWLVHQAISHVSGLTGMDVGVGRVSLLFPLDLTLEEVVVRTEKGGDTLVAAGRLRVRCDILPLLRRQVEVSSIELINGEVHTGQMFPEMMIDACVGGLRFDHCHFRPTDEVLEVEAFRLTEADIAIRLEAVQKKEEKKEMPFAWKFCIEKTRMQMVNVRLETPDKAASWLIGWNELAIESADIWPLRTAYEGLQVTLSDGYVEHGGRPLPWANAKWSLDADSVEYQGTEASAILRQLSVDGGASMLSASGNVVVDSLEYRLSDIDVRTPHSHLSLNASMDRSVSAKGRQSNFTVVANGRVAGEDLFAWLHSPPSINVAQKALDVAVNVSGRMEQEVICYADLQMDEWLKVKARGAYDMRSHTYSIDTRIDNMQLPKIGQGDSIIRLSGYAQAKGQGKEEMELDIQCESNNPYIHLQTEIELDKVKAQEGLSVRLVMDVQDADLQAVGVSENPLVASFRANLSAESRLHGDIRLNGEMTDMSLSNDNGFSFPKNLSFSAFSQPDSLNIQVKAGDLALSLKAQENIVEIIRQTEILVGEWKQGTRYHRRESWPNLTCILNAGNQNPLRDFLSHAGKGRMNRLHVEVQTSAQEGIRGDVVVCGGQYGDVLSDTIHISAKQDTTGTFLCTLDTHEITWKAQTMGTWMMKAVCSPVSPTEYVVNAGIGNDGHEVATLEGNIHSAPNAPLLDAHVSLMKLPVRLVNLFLSDTGLTFDGELSSELDVQYGEGTPRIEGKIGLEAFRVRLPSYALEFHFSDNQSLKIKDSRLKFDAMKVYAQGKNPLVVNGEIIFEDLAHIMTDLTLSADRYELLNVREDKNSLVYGKVFVSLSSTVRGEISHPIVRGHMKVLGNTDVTYVLKDSPLAATDRMGGIVTFVNLSDTVQVVDIKKETVSNGVDVMLDIEIEPAVSLQVELGSGGYVKSQGGGRLNWQYIPQGDMSLTGRYTLIGGEMKYSLPVLPAKTFHIANGSYVEFMGNPQNPYLSVKATERVRTTVTEADKPRYVNFDVGISLNNTLADAELDFTIEAPEDIALQNQLAGMTADERTGIAMTMLVAGIYVGGDDASGGGFNTGNAFGNFLQKEMTNIAGSFLKNVDVSIGAENNYTETGERGGTDYSFRFAKRFWNNRLSVVVGGRIYQGGGQDDAADESPFIDDISLEWKVDNSGNRLIKIFHTKNHESIFEGEIIETGVGFVFRYIGGGKRKE